MFRRAALVIVFTLSSVNAQPTDTAIRFEVASIKPSAPPNGGTYRRYYVGTRGGPGSTDPGRMMFSHVTVATLVAQAYDIYAFQLSCHDWLNSEKFDIIAKVPEGATKEQVPVMLQNLLADRFKLKVHREMRDMPVFELSVAKGEPKLKMANGDSPHQETATREPSLAKDGFPAIPAGQTSKWVMNGRARWQSPDGQIEQLTQMLAGELGKPVIDATGLKGRYSFSLYWIQPEMKATQLAATSDPEAAMLADSATEGAVGPTIFHALRDQLGLRLDPKKGSASVLVVDSAERQPTEN